MVALAVKVECGGGNHLMLHQVKSFPGSVCSFGCAWAEAGLTRILEEMY